MGILTGLVKLTTHLSVSNSPDNGLGGSSAILYCYPFFATQPPQTDNQLEPGQLHHTTPHHTTPFPTLCQPQRNTTSSNSYYYCSPKLQHTLFHFVNKKK
ncbi:hypothetical protein VTJ04DRAFT_6603 [Mycothermus thermophilus]|uniref:uncharacterized protein n=1 Tax=Humicola insolens TaxID=85995 RepID=UPI0037420B97